MNRSLLIKFFWHCRVDEIFELVGEEMHVNLS